MISRRSGRGRLCCAQTLLSTAKSVLALALEHIADGPRPRGKCGDGVIWFDGDPHPQAEELADAELPRLAQADKGIHGRWRAALRFIAAFLIFEGLARSRGVFIDGFLHLAGPIDLLGQRIED